MKTAAEVRDKVRDGKRKRNEAFRCFILRHFSSSGIARCSVVFLSRTKAGVIFVIFCKKKQKFYKL